MSYRFFGTSNSSCCLFRGGHTPNICPLCYVFHSKLLAEFRVQIKSFPRAFWIFQATLFKCALLGASFGGLGWAQVNRAAQCIGPRIPKGQPCWVWAKTPTEQETSPVPRHSSSSSQVNLKGPLVPVHAMQSPSGEPVGQCSIGS